MDHNTLQRARQLSLYFTMTMAILLFVNWALGGFKDHSGDIYATLQLVLLIALCTGGVVMGIFWVIYLVTRKK